MQRSALSSGTFIERGGVASRGTSTKLQVVRGPMFEFRLFLWLRFALAQITQPLLSSLIISGKSKMTGRAGSDTTRSWTQTYSLNFHRDPKFHYYPQPTDKETEPWGV